MKTVVIGCGGIAHSSHLPSMARYAGLHPGFTIAACCDKNAAQAESTAKEYGIAKYYTDMETMLDAEKPDAAVCLVSAEVNHVVGGRLIERGIPVLMEKPPGTTMEQLESLLDQYRKHGTFHMVAFNRRFFPVFDRVKELAANEAPRYLDYTMYRIRRHDDDFSTTAIHGVDAVRHLLGSDYARLEMRYQPLPQHGPGVVNMVMFGEMINGARVTLRVMVSTGDIEERCELHTDTRIIRAGAAYKGRLAGMGDLEVTQNGKRILKLSGLDIDPSGENYTSNGFYREHEVFYDCLSRGAMPPSQLADAVQSVAICEALRNRAAVYEG